MSTKTSFKRVALVAVAALGMGVLTSVSPASAGTVTATIDGGIRVTYNGTTRDSVQAQTFSFVPDAATTAGSNDDVILTVTEAPASAAEVEVTVGAATVKDSLAKNIDTEYSDTDTSLGSSLVSGTKFSTTTTIKVSDTGAAAGTYKGTIVIQDDASATVTIAFSFTTTGAPKTLKSSVGSVGFPALAYASGYKGYSSFDLTLLDANNNVTQPSSGDTVEVSLASYTNISASESTGSEGSAAVTLDQTDLNKLKTVYVGSRTTEADSEVVTLTPKGVLPGLGVAAITVAASSAAVGTGTGVTTAITAPSSASVIAAHTTAARTWNVDESVKSYSFNVSGWSAGAAYSIGVYAINGSAGTTPTATINATTGDLIETVTGLATSAPVAISVVLASQAATDGIKIDGNGDGDFTDSSDIEVILVAASFTHTVTAPAVTPVLQKAGTPIVIKGKFVDTFGNPASGASVSVSTVMTPSTETALTGSATTAADGTYTVTLTPTATTTRVVFTAAATKTGIGSSSASAVTVNFNATGNPGTLTYLDNIGDQDSALTATTLPISLVPYNGTLAGQSGELYTIATAASDAGGLDATDVCVAFTPSTDVGAQIVVTGSAGVKFTETCSGALSTLEATITVASGVEIFAVSTKTGENTVTFTSGTLTKTAKFMARNYVGTTVGDAIRNIVPVSTTVAAAAGEITYITLQATDVFGNAVKNATSGAVTAFPGTITAKASGQVLLDGPALSRTYNTTDADGNIIIGIIASGKAGSGSVAITSVAGTSGQLGAAAGAVTGTTAGTITEFAASKSTATVSVTVAGGAADVAALTTLVNSLLKKINAMQSLLNKIQKKLGVK